MCRLFVACIYLEFVKDEKDTAAQLVEMSMICQYSNHSHDCLSNMWAVLLLQAGRRCLLKAETRVKSQVTSFQLRDAQNDIAGRPACSFFGFTLSVIHDHLIVVHFRF